MPRAALAGAPLDQHHRREDVGAVALLDRDVDGAGAGADRDRPLLDHAVALDGEQAGRVAHRGLQQQARGLADLVARLVGDDVEPLVVLRLRSRVAVAPRPEVRRGGRRVAGRVLALDDRARSRRDPGGVKRTSAGAVGAHGDRLLHHLAVLLLAAVAAVIAPRLPGAAPVVAHDLERAVAGDAVPLRIDGDDLDRARAVGRADRAAAVDAEVERRRGAPGWRRWRRSSGGSRPGPRR